ncbi:PHP domain-containing protein [Natronobacterium gregoryi]|uniref:Metal-dependent phosphoesterase (PHP family)-like protein n=2 Tax=Natronobacterium gregoryi TaxID=44930 RepID=L0AIG5_NATGS|nr:PHP-associated domain-containing protein [Natronobacterium gregoryi]AFZ73234.1 putative metal-dependent phosphoesterase, PHP family [Natronobacterium gregoryi SP2]ELY71308.1 metal-dependent phosphoesterase (PHP family)-like protein [Natronobacterium gregoryi SP2]PLK21642.1 PHP domain-containing protein [Natronobacterium gregoryi SP2]SFI57830.1 Predicted metal-dependent phosphoesterase TrpH, contains PHP domain [Natronobacterium gregoryi]
MSERDGTAGHVDCHVKVLDDGVVERATRAGLDVIVYAPHFTRLPEIRERAETYSSEDLLVVPGREVFTGSWHDRKHVLALGLEEPVPDFIPLEAAMAEFERQDATVLAPHPEFTTVGLEESDVERYGDLIDAIEVFNPKHLPPHNRRARDIAERAELPPFTSSYAHLPRTVGVSHTAFDTAIETETDLLSALEDDIGRRVVYENGVGRWTTTATELAHLVYENTWKKADRLFLSGIEPTHPRHIAYDGRFEDDAVY